MPVEFLAYLLIAALGVVLATGWGRVHPFLAMTVAIVAFGFACSLPISLMGRSYGDGFVETLNTVGLVVIAGAVIGVFAAETGAAARLAAAFAGWGEGVRAALLAALGFVTGVASTPAAAFAVLAPFRQAIASSTRRENAVSSASLGLGLSASHGMVLPAPCPVAAAAIFAADPLRVFLFGVPVAIVAAIAGALYAAFAGRRLVAEASATAPVTSRAAVPGRYVAALILPVAAMTLLLIVQSLGEIPSEPLGGGPIREFLLGVGRPAWLLVIGVGLAILLTWRWDAAAISMEGWVGKAIMSVAELLLLIGVGGSLQKLTQVMGLAELLAEPLLGWHGGLLLPFVVAALVKCVQGSSLVAAITAAGMTAPLLPALGLGSETGRALATLAVGAGAMSGSTLNDGFFWLVAGTARLTPGRGIALFSLGTIFQGVVAALLLAALGLFLA
jgi:GntP family gluconate:H+ symporter